MNENIFGEIVALAKEMKATLDLYLNELDKCVYAIKDIPVNAIRRRTQKYLSDLDKDIDEIQKLIGKG